MGTLLARDRKSIFPFLFQLFCFFGCTSENPTLLSQGTEPAPNTVADAPPEIEGIKDSGVLPPWRSIFLSELSDQSLPGQIPTARFFLGADYGTQTFAFPNPSSGAALLTMPWNSSVTLNQFNLLPTQWKLTPGNSTKILDQPILSAGQIILKLEGFGAAETPINVMGIDLDRTKVIRTLTKSEMPKQVGFKGGEAKLVNYYVMKGALKPDPLLPNSECAPNSENYQYEIRLQATLRSESDYNLEIEVIPLGEKCGRSIRDMSLKLRVPSSIAKYISHPIRYDYTMTSERFENLLESTLSIPTSELTLPNHHEEIAIGTERLGMAIAQPRFNKCSNSTFKFFKLSAPTVIQGTSQRSIDVDLICDSSFDLRKGPTRFFHTIAFFPFPNRPPRLLSNHVPLRGELTHLGTNKWDPSDWFALNSGESYATHFSENHARYSIGFDAPVEYKGLPFLTPLSTETPEEVNHRYGPGSSNYFSYLKSNGIHIMPYSAFYSIPSRLPKSHASGKIDLNQDNVWVVRNAPDPDLSDQYFPYKILQKNFNGKPFACFQGNCAVEDLQWNALATSWIANPEVRNLMSLGQWNPFGWKEVLGTSIDTNGAEIKTLKIERIEGEMSARGLSAGMRACPFVLEGETLSICLQSNVQFGSTPVSMRAICPGAPGFKEFMAGNYEVSKTQGARSAYLDLSQSYSRCADPVTGRDPWKENDFFYSPILEQRAVMREIYKRTVVLWAVNKNGDRAPTGEVDPDFFLLQHLPKPVYSVLGYGELLSGEAFNQVFRAQANNTSKVEWCKNDYDYCPDYNVIPDHYFAFSVSPNHGFAHFVLPQIVASFGSSDDPKVTIPSARTLLEKSRDFGFGIIRARFGQSNRCLASTHFRKLEDFGVNKLAKQIEFYAKTETTLERGSYSLTPNAEPVKIPIEIGTLCPP